MKPLGIALYLVVAAINLAPVSGVVSAGRLEALYGVAVSDPSFEILLRHRAVLFGVVGVLLALAAFRETLRPVAVAAGLVSMLSFVVIAWGVGGYNAEVGRVLVVDLVALPLLVAAAAIDLWRRSRGPET